MSSTPEQHLVLIDGHALFHRSFHAFPDEMTTQDGQPTNAVYGFTRMLLDVLRILKPDYLIMTFDRPTPTFRHKEFAPYKAQRPPLPETMRPQFPKVREIVRAFGIPIYELDGFEADDFLGTLARHVAAQARGAHRLRCARAAGSPERPRVALRSDGCAPALPPARALRPGGAPAAPR